MEILASENIRTRRYLQKLQNIRVAHRLGHSVGHSFRYHKKGDKYPYRDKKRPKIRRFLRIYPPLVPKKSW